MIDEDGKVYDQKFIGGRGGGSLRNLSKNFLK